MISPEFRLRAFVARLRGFLRGHRPDAEFNNEVREHLQLLAERFVAQQHRLTARGPQRIADAFTRIFLSGIYCIAC